MGNNNVLRKRFFSSARESRWLNRLGSRGMRLWALNDRRYSFSKEEGKQFFYTLEWQDRATESEESRQYILEKAEAEQPVCSQRSLWLYFISEKPCGYTKSALKKNRARYRNPFLFFLILTLICVGLAVYHVQSIPFLQEQELLIAVPTFKGNENPVLDLLLRLVYGLWTVAYSYFMLFGRLLGNTLATAVVSVLAPLALVFFILCLVWGIEWVRWLRVKPAADPVPDREKHEDEEPPAFGPDEPEDESEADVRPEGNFRQEDFQPENFQLEGEEDIELEEDFQQEENAGEPGPKSDGPDGEEVFQ